MPVPTKDILRNYRELRDNMRKADALLLECITHPDVTDEQILMVCHERRASWVQFRKVHASVVEVCYKRGVPPRQIPDLNLR